MRRSRNSWAAAALLALALASPGGAQNASEKAAQKPSLDTRRVGHRIACQCGCVDTVATCAMLECSFSNPAKVKIAKLQAAGEPDQKIIDQFIAEFGPQVYRGHPNAFGWIVPYAALLAGLAAIFFFVRRYRRANAVPAPQIDEASITRYRAQIDKDLAHME